MQIDKMYRDDLYENTNVEADIIETQGKDIDFD
jgi:hypothetical protein